MDKSYPKELMNLLQSVKQAKRDGNFDIALNLIDALVEKSRKFPETQGEMLNLALAEKGAILIELSRFDEASSTLKMALDYFENQKDTWNAGLCRASLGELYLKMGKYEDAERETLLSLQSSNGAESLEPYMLSSISRCWSNLGKIHLAMGEKEKAKADCLKALDIRKQLADSDEERLEDVANAYQALGYATCYPGNYDEAKQYYNASLAIYERLQTRGKKDFSRMIDLGKELLKVIDESAVEQ